MPTSKEAQCSGSLNFDLGYFPPRLGGGNGKNLRLTLLSADVTEGCIPLRAVAPVTGHVEPDSHACESVEQGALDSLALALRACAADAEAIGDILDQHRDDISDVRRLTTLLSLLGASKAARTALLVGDWVNYNGLELNLYHYNSLISACEKSGLWEEAFRVLAKLKVAGKLRPDTVTYTTLISACEKAGKWERALRLYSVMIAEGVPPNVMTYSALIAACRRGGQWKWAMTIYLDMRAASVAPNKMTYSALMAALGEGKQLDRARLLLDQMRNEGVWPDAAIYNALITACRHDKNWELALQTFQQMEAAGVAPDRTTYNALLTVLGEARKTAQALKLFETMRVPPDTVTYTAVIHLLGDDGQCDKAYQLFSAMPARAIPRDIHAYTAMLSAYAHAHSAEAAEKARLLHVAMQDEGFKPSVISYNTLITAYRNAAQPTL
ncbi:hypothetical protein CYMTET_17051 [Cymbomonas tetramitiformis]|uniref:Pentacotripeptide-repeat region of PRORP domain-containing protein n=1 Tax=Cymbomonas tetramitiformis TaxID=36881 RepID=A0AAE0GB57_9CHLO|nr:hypothetical protein CYMTET_17051 [Cymbomonas tetramitiformis]